jgi:hypothetical protein
MGKRKSKFTKPAIIADAIGVTHFIFANLLVVLGEVTGVFGKPWENFTGLRFLYTYVDAPVHTFMTPFMPEQFDDPVTAYLIAELIIILSSVLYGLIAYAICRFLSKVSG